MPIMTSGSSSSSPGPDHTALPLVAALGDVNRHDYGVGPAVLRHLDGRGLDATLVSSDGNDATLVKLWQGRSLAIVVDPVRADPCHPGRVHRFVVARPDSGRLIVFAIETAETADGAGLSPAVAAAARRVADAIAAEIAAAQSPPAEPSARPWRWAFTRTQRAVRPARA